MQTHLIPFQSDTIVAYERDGQLLIAIKPLCERLGIAFEPQLAKLRTDSNRWGMTIIVIPSSGGAQQTACLPKAKLFGWLNSIHPGKVAEKARPALRRYQAECDAVLDAWWSRKLGLPGGLALGIDVQGDQATLAVTQMMQLLLDRMERMETRLSATEAERAALADFAGGRVPRLRISPEQVPLAPFRLTRPKFGVKVQVVTGRDRRAVERLLRAGFSNVDAARAMNMSLAYFKKLRRALETEGRIEPDPSLIPMRRQVFDTVAAHPRPRRTLDPILQYGLALEPRSGQHVR